MEEHDDDEEPMAVDSEEVNKAPEDKVPTIKKEVKHTEEEISNHNGLNHSEFAAGERFVSTTFVENLSPPKLETCIAVIFKHTINDMMFQKIPQMYLTMQTAVR